MIGKTNDESMDKLVKRTKLSTPRERPVPKQAFPHSHHRISMKGRGRLISDFDNIKS